MVCSSELICITNNIVNVKIEGIVNWIYYDNSVKNLVILGSILHLDYEINIVSLENIRLNT